VKRAKIKPAAGRPAVALDVLIANYDAAEALLRKAEDRRDELCVAHSVSCTELDDNPKGKPVKLRAARAAELKLLAAYGEARRAIVNYQPTSPADAAELLQYAILNEAFHSVDFHNDDEMRVTVRNAVAAVRRGPPIRKSTDSEIIRQCVVYAQAFGAYFAGYKVDASGDSEYAGNGHEMRDAERALEKLNTLSRTIGEPPAPLTAIELYAKAGVLAALYGLLEHQEPNETEREYIGHVARETLRCLAARCEEVQP
jgi:hypothetical protein